MSERTRVRYSQLPHDLADEHPEIWDDDRKLAAYVRLKVLADRVYPYAATLPRRVSDRLLEVFVAEGLILRSGESYRMPEVDAARDALSQAGSRGALKRWGSNPSADSRATGEGTGPPNGEAIREATGPRDAVGVATETDTETETEKDSSLRSESPKPESTDAMTG